MFCAIFNFQTRSRVHAAFRHVGTKGVPAYMGRDLWHLHFIDTVVLLANVLKVFLPMQGYHRHIIFVQIQKTTFAINHRLFFYFLPIRNNPLKTRIYLVGHWDFPCAACGFGILNPFSLNEMSSRLPCGVHDKRMSK